MRRPGQRVMFTGYCYVGSRIMILRLSLTPARPWGVLTVSGKVLVKKLADALKDKI